MLVKSVVRFGMYVALTVSPSLALAQVAPPSTTGVQPEPAVATKVAVSGTKHYDPDEVICRYTAVTGTRFPKRACLRRADWDQIAQDSKDALNHATSITNKPGG